MKNTLKHESIMVSVASGEQVHMMRFYEDKNCLGTPVFMLHSAAQEGKSFYDGRGGGLACYLARQGYDVYVGDLRGRGKSWPKVNPFSKFGSHQLITEDIPAMLKKIISKRGPVPQVWVSHGWGGVLMCAYYARFADSLCPVARMVHFAVRRQAHPISLQQKWWFNVVMGPLSRLLIRINGYLPAKFLRLGSCNESARIYQDYQQWSQQERWIDTEDGFDYGQAILQQQLPPSFYFASRGDTIYGHADHIRQFMMELGPHDGRLMVLDQQAGSLHDYGHDEMLHHEDCEEDHFPLLLDWLEEAGTLNTAKNMKA